MLLRVVFTDLKERQFTPHMTGVLFIVTKAVDNRKGMKVRREVGEGFEVDVWEIHQERPD